MTLGRPGVAVVHQSVFEMSMDLLAKAGATREVHVQRGHARVQRCELVVAERLAVATQALYEIDIARGGEADQLHGWIVLQAERSPVRRLA